MTLTGAPGEGAEWRDAAQGAVVAARRFALGGTKVTLVAVNDKGTSDGATTAVKTLAGRNVAAIVVATTGAHVTAGLTQAAADKIPVLMPYDQGAAGAAGQVWSTGPGTPGHRRPAGRADGGARPGRAAAGRRGRRARHRA